MTKSLVYEGVLPSRKHDRRTVASAGALWHELWKIWNCYPRAGPIVMVQVCFGELGEASLTSFWIDTSLVGEINSFKRSSELRFVLHKWFMDVSGNLYVMDTQVPAG